MMKLFLRCNIILFITAILCPAFVSSADTLDQAIEGLSPEDLAQVLNHGRLLFFEEREEPDTWDVIVGELVNAPPEIVWDTITDLKDFAEHPLEGTNEFNIISISDTSARVNARSHVNIPPFSVKMHSELIYTFLPPHRVETRVAEGDREGGYYNWRLIPVAQGRQTILFLTYYGNLKSLGFPFTLLLRMVPPISLPPGLAASSHLVNIMAQRAEARAGNIQDRQPDPINVQAISPDVLARLSRRPAFYLFREEADGAPIDAFSGVFINAPLDTAWSTITDYHKWNEFMAKVKIYGESDVKVKTSVIEEYPDRAVLDQNLVITIFYIIKVGIGGSFEYLYDQENKRIVFSAIDHDLRGTRCEFVLLPGPEKDQCMLFETASWKISEDADFLGFKAMSKASLPLGSMINTTSTSVFLMPLKAEAERRHSSSSEKQE
jgi:hypothetical protein